MTPIAFTYDHRLVALSFLIAVLTSYTALDLAARITVNQGRSRLLWLLGGAIAMGTGIWAMHYTGMLACLLPIRVYYHLPTVALSLVAAILASAVALYVVSRPRVRHWDIVAGSVFMGSGIAAMHYTGMAAMRLGAVHHYNRAGWMLSVSLAVVISYVGMLLIFHSRDGDRGWKRMTVIACVMGLAIPAMHYTGMAACTFMPTAMVPDLARSADISTLANLGILVATGLILGFALLTSLVDRRLSAKQLQIVRERQMLRALIDNIPDAMYVKDAQGRFVLANQQLTREVGLTFPHQLIGKTDFDVHPRESARILFTDEQEVLQSGYGLFNREERSIGEDGCERYVLTTKVALRNDRGEITGIAAVSRNITERKLSELAQLEAERKYRLIFDEAIVGIFQVSADGRFLSLNPAMAETLGSTLEDLLAIGAPTFAELHVDTKRWAQMLSAVQAEGRVRNFESEVVRADGTRLWLSSSVHGISEEGSIVRYEGMSEDVTERNQLRDKLLQAQKLESVGQLAAGVAHEINTPIQYIGDNVRFLQEAFTELHALFAPYAELLSKAQADELEPDTVRKVSAAVGLVDTAYLIDEIPKAIEQTLEGISRVATLVSAMKEFSHPGKKEKHPVDLNHAIQSTITVARNEWKYVAELHTDFDPTLPFVSCLPGEFNQVILNMIVNAAHAIADASGDRVPGQGTITIQTRNTPDFAEIRIADTGCGMPDHVRRRIFDPFFTTKEVGRGTGQGLAIAHSVIVDKHSGAIDVESVEGQGTTFIIRLPHDKLADETLAVAA